jgi:N-acetylmuramoyl-L-alanine amidase
MDDNGWDDIGYSFLIGGDGNAYQGRSWNRVGAHAPNFNDKSIGICLMGDFTVSLPPPIQLEVAKSLIECGLEFNHIDPNYTLLGHRDVRATECPGESLYQEILTWPHKGLPPTKTNQ